MGQGFLRKGGSRSIVVAMENDEKTIKLGQFLKFMNLAETGGQAKRLIQAGLVKVNGEVEIRRGRKLQPGDLVTIDDQTIRVELD